MPGTHVTVDAQNVTLDIVRVGGRYRMGKLLGAGAFGTSINLKALWTIISTSFYLGTVYLGKDIKKGQDVAVKLEVAQEWDSRLEREHDVYQAMSGIRGIPKMLWYGVEGRYNVMVLSRLGRTLEEMKQLKMLDANTVFAYSKQMVFSPFAQS
jgi:hypothetical protein